MAGLPVRGAAVEELELPLPPEPMPMLRRRRLLKRWRYVGVFSPEVMLCAADARIGPIPRRWWAVAEPDGRLYERATLGRGGVRVEPGAVVVRAGEVDIELHLEESSEGVEVVSGDGAGYLWTRKQGGVPARGALRIEGRRQPLQAEAVVDESAGYHPRRTSWRWCAGVGRGERGERLAWNLVTGIHDSPHASERTVWIDGVPREPEPVEIAPDLSEVRFAEGGRLEFRPWCERSERVNVLLLRSEYRQPFGSFAGDLPGGARLAHGQGVMEAHEARW